MLYPAIAVLFILMIPLLFLSTGFTKRSMLTAKDSSARGILSGQILVG
jgi:hypothetical protein